ncbi:hypothetical protein WMO40_20665 [Bacillaceae bacterium CLA-AA-H227]|uniref:Uncharacterized protein n=1 Tax=Robertmurraya yapensis (ex Hitch et al 2024) TaxID=3133160 RepID=A0ACC6SGD0_9BACI
MNSKLSKFIGIGIVLLLFIEIVGNIITSRAEEEEKNPIDADGMIKEGYSVSFEKEKEMAEDSYPDVSTEEYQEQLMYAISQCIITSKSLNSYECIGNNLQDSYFKSTLDNKTPSEKGEYLYQTLLQGRTPTGVDVGLVSSTKQQQIYEVTINTLESKNPFSYLFTLQDRKIQSINLQKKEGI